MPAMAEDKAGSPVPSIRETLLAQIDAFCAEWDMNQTEFGRQAVNDPAFVTRLRGKTNIGIARIDAARRFMATYRPQGRAKR